MTGALDEEEGQVPEGPDDGGDEGCEGEREAFFEMGLEDHAPADFFEAAAEDHEGEREKGDVKRRGEVRGTEEERDGVRDGDCGEDEEVIEGLLFENKDGTEEFSGGGFAGFKEKDDRDDRRHVAAEDVEDHHRGRAKCEGTELVCEDDAPPEEPCEAEGEDEVRHEDGFGFHSEGPPFFSM